MATCLPAGTSPRNMKRNSLKSSFLLPYFWLPINPSFYPGSSLIYLPLESFAHSVYRICLHYKRAEQKNDQLTAFLSLPLSTVINDPIKVMWFSFEFGLLRTKGNMQINRASGNYYSHK